MLSLPEEFSPSTDISGGAGEEEELVFSGPSMASRAGKRTRPWNKPNTTVSTNTWDRLAHWQGRLTLKKEMKTWEDEAPRSTKARKVVIPPLSTAKPMVAMASCALSNLEPEIKQYDSQF